MAVISRPQRNDLGPRCLLIAVQAYPVVLVVSRQADLARELQANETLMVVGGGVDEMAEDFFLRPLARVGF